MLKLGKEAFLRVCENIEEKCRPLDISIYDNYFHNGKEDNILKELKKFQNPDGGFGQGLELDFLLPKSSAIATSIAFQNLIKLEHKKNAKSMIKNGIEYLENSFFEERSGWYSVPKEVNDFPHAPWWHYDNEIKSTIIDNHWGNPSAELIGYLYRYGMDSSTLNIEGLLKIAFEHLLSIKKFVSFHEVYCYQRLFKMLPAERTKGLEPKLSYAIEELICTDINCWDNYVAKPLDFLESPNDPKYGINEAFVELNLDYLVKKLEINKMIVPNWIWAGYENEWEISKTMWTGALTLKALMKLDSFGRVQMDGDIGLDQSRK